MKHKLLKLNKYIKSLLVAGAVVLASCSGGGNCAPAGSGNTGDVSSLKITAPSAYPAGVAVSVPIVVTNNGGNTINNLLYSIDAGSNTTGATITITTTSAANCKIIPLGQSCTLIANIPATSHAGSFTLTAEQKATQSIKAVQSVISSISSPIIGLISSPINTEIGANGINLFYPASVIANSDGSTQIMVTAYVSSPNAGDFNTIQLVDNNGNVLNYTVVSGNSGSGMSNLTQGSIVSFLVTIPSGASQLQLKAQTAKDEVVKSTASNSNAVIVNPATSKTGILNVTPNYFNLTESYQSQIVTLSNSGNGSLSGLDIAAQNGLEVINNTCGSSLAVGATCSYVVKFNPLNPVSGTSSVVLNYNDGTTDQSSTATVNYKGVNAVADLTISSSNNNFDYITRTSSPTQSYVVTLTNNGNSPESNFTYDLPGYFSVSTSGVTKPCTVETVLQVGEQCNINLIYSNNVKLNQTTNTVTVNYKYGQENKSASSNVSVTYQTIQSTAILSLTPNPAAFANIYNNGADSNSQTITLLNSGDETATLQQPAISDNAVFIPGSCSKGSLTAGESCAYSVNFGPVGNSISGNESGVMTVDYTPYTGGSATATTARLNGFVVQAQGANISLVRTTASGFAGGDGSSGTPYMVENGAALPTITYTITNSGAVPADNFYIDGTSSSGWTVIDNQCGTSASKITLAVSNGSCTVKFQLDSTAGSTTTTIAAPTLDLSSLNMNWTDQDTPGGETQAMVGQDYVSIYPQATITIVPTTATLSPGDNTTVTATLTGGYSVADQTITLSDSSAPADEITIAPASCVLNSGTSSCSFVVQTTANTPAATYPLTVGYSGIMPNVSTIELSVRSSAQLQMLLAQSSAYGCMLKVTTNTAYCWGSNRDGELGNGTNTNTATPTAVATGGSSAIPNNANLLGITAGSASGGHASSCVISADGNMYCWGYGGQGALGNESYISSNTPVSVLKGGVSAIPSDAILTFASTCGSNSCAVDESGNAYCWGSGNNGQLGNNSTTSSNVPVSVLKGGISEIPASAKITSISIGYHYGCAVDSDGEAYCWGVNPKGNFGNGNTTNSKVPVKVLKGGASAIAASEKIIQISVTKDHSDLLALTTCAVTNLGNAYCWGYNANGALGNDSTTDSNVPILVQRGGSSAIPSTAKFTNIETSGQSTCAVADALGYCWGQNQRGQLGDNSITNSLVAKAVTVGGNSAVPMGVSLINIGTGFDDAYSNAMSSCSQGSDGNFYCWGDNTYGELGGGTIGTPPYSMLPVKVLIP